VQHKTARIGFNRRYATKEAVENVDRGLKPTATVVTSLRDEFAFLLRDKALRKG
jgi:hypothetical protein